MFSRYALDDPHAWAFDVMAMLYGTLFMMAGAYTLAKNGHVRGDVLYGFFTPRTQATIDLWGVGTKVSRRLTALGVTTVQELADAPADALVAEFGPRMGVWYHELGQGLGPTTVDDAPWVARGHSRETTFQQNLTTPEQVRDAVRAMAHGLPMRADRKHLRQYKEGGDGPERGPMLSLAGRFLLL